MLKHDTPDRRQLTRCVPDQLCYVRVYCHEECFEGPRWSIHDVIVLDVSATHLRVYRDFPISTEYRICHADANDVRRATLTREDSGAVVFRVGDPIEKPSIQTVDCDLSFLNSHYEYMQRLRSDSELPIDVLAFA